MVRDPKHLRKYCWCCKSNPTYFSSVLILIGTLCTNAQGLPSSTNTSFTSAAAAVFAIAGQLQHEMKRLMLLAAAS